MITVVPADQCSPLTSSHGHLSTSSSTYGTIVIVTCDVGYVMSNNNLMTSVMCLGNGTWNETVEPCEGRKTNNDPGQYLTYFLTNLSVYMHDCMQKNANSPGGAQLAHLAKKKCI